MRNITYEQRIFIESQVLSAENFAAHIYNQIGQLRQGLYDPDLSLDEFSQLLQTFQEGAHCLVQALDTVKENLHEPHPLQRVEPS
jgi:hypothetical protein